MSGSQAYSISYDCKECSMKFENAKQLANHVKNFCVYSPYGNMQSLIQVQQRDIQYERVDPNRTHLMQDYGKQTLGKMKTLVGGDQPNNLTQNALRNRQQELLDDLVKYRDRQRNALGNSGYSDYAKNASPTLQESQVRAVSGRRDFTSPPSMPYQSQSHPQPALEKAKQQQQRVYAHVKDMTEAERWEYADNKLRELESIKESYVENGGNDVYFLSHLDSLYKFYNELKTAKRVSQVRISTPINKLRGSAESTNQMQQQTRQTNRQEQQRSEVRPFQPNPGRSVQREILNPTTTQQQQPIQQYSPPNQYQQYYPNQMMQQPQQNSPYQPPVIVLQQPPQPQYTQPKESDNRSLAYLEKMLQMKEDQNRKLMELMIKKNEQQQPQRQYQVPHNSEAFSSTRHPLSKSNASHIPKLTANRMYAMEPIADDVLPEQRVLISMGKEELDELRLLNMLPEDLQKIRFETLKNMSELRSKVQKDLHQQRLERMRHQFQQQAKEEQRMFENELWVDNQRKQALSQRLLEDEAIM